MVANRGSGVEPIPLRLTTSQTGQGAITLGVAGEIDIATVGVLTARMSELVQDPDIRRLSVDFAEVTFLDSSGVGALMAALQQAQQAETEFVVANCQGRVRRVLEITGVVKALTGNPGDLG